MGTVVERADLNAWHGQCFRVGREGTSMKRKPIFVTRPERVEQLMSRSVATCRPGDHLDQAARIMWDRDCGSVPVTVPDEGGERVVGMITDRDVCMAAYTNGRPLADLTVATAMSANVQTCGPGDAIGHALTIMAAAKVHRLPVVDDAGHLVGLLSLADVATEEARCHKVVPADVLAQTLEAISTPRPHDLVIAS
jgi:CBS domain-containing protein